MDGAEAGILAIWQDVIPQTRADTLAWYDREHHFERLAVPGFRNVRRYRAIEARPELFIRYETESVGVLSSDAYLARVNAPTPWTLRAQPGFRNNSRTVCARKVRSGKAEGGFAVTIRLSETAGAELADALDWAAAMDSLTLLDGVVGAEFWLADRQRSIIRTREKEIRGPEDVYVGAVVVMHATSREAAERAMASGVPGLAPATVAGAESGIYRLAFAASNSIW